MKWRILKILISLITLSSALFIYFRPPQFEVVQVKKDKVVEAVYATGTVESEVMYPLSSQVSARLLTLNVDEGDLVKKDQLLATLDGAEFKEQERQLKIREQFAKDQFNRAQKLYSQKAISEDEYTRSKSEWEASQAMTRSAKGKSEYTILRALHDGIVIRRDGEVGQLIPANQAIYWIAENGNLRVTAEVDEEEILRVQVGQKVYMQADALPNQVIEGSVIKITPQGDRLSRSYRVRISLPKNNPLMIGMTVENNILIGEKENALIVPSSAVRNGFVWVVNNDTVESRKIKMGVKDLERTEIVSGVSDTDVVVKDPSQTLTEGMRIRPVSREK